MKFQSRVMMCLLTSLSVQAASQDSDSNDGGSIADAESRFLFINMLEFLGEFETENGDWISPDVLGNEVFADLDSQENTNSESSPAEQRLLSAPEED